VSVIPNTVSITGVCGFGLSVAPAGPPITLTVGPNPDIHWPTVIGWNWRKIVSVWYLDSSAVSGHDVFKLTLDTGVSGSHSVYVRVN